MNERREQGQAIVLIVIAMVAIFGFLALAVDGGRIYAERRRAQSAADAAAYAAAFNKAMGEPGWAAKAVDQLKMNGYDDSIITDTGLPIDVIINNPPNDASVPGRYEDPLDYIQVIIRTKVDPVFSQFVYSGPLTMTVEAVAKAAKSTRSIMGKALVSLGDRDICAPMKFHGNNTFNLRGGDIYSHSPRGMAGDNCEAVNVNGGITIDVKGGAIMTPGNIGYSGGSNSVTTTAGIQTGIPQLDIPRLPVPDCGGLPARSYGGGSETLEPGIYAGGIKVTGTRTSVKLKPGMYCLDDDLTINGGQITSIGIPPSTEPGVMIVMRRGKLYIGGNTIVHLVASTYLEDISKQKWGGMLIYMPYNNDSEVYMGGGGNSHYTGTVYAPGPRTPKSQTKCTITGNSNTIAFNTAFICYSIALGGTSDINIYYREKQNYQLPPMLQLDK